MGDAMKADGAFIGQDVSVTPLIGKLRLHIQGYVDKEEFFISPLKHEDVILGAPWFDHLAASIKFPERKISFKFREKNMYINAQELGSTIPLVNDQDFDKSIKSSIFAYMIFVKDSLNGVNETKVTESGMQEDLELSNFLNQFQDVFIDNIPGELPPKRGDDDHMIELIPGSSPPNKPPYRVSQAQQEEIMRQVNELVEKGMVRPSSSPFCSPVLLVQKKDGTYQELSKLVGGLPNSTVFNGCWEAGIQVSSTNTRTSCDRGYFAKIVADAKPYDDPETHHLSSFLYSRLSSSLLERPNFLEFTHFVACMHGFAVN
ncbi:hypothetical protein L7F22_013880 [Adiantum nelumboides]|nr:hypothetical protein [Adiantum nelumboides]